VDTPASIAEGHGASSPAGPGRGAPWRGAEAARAARSSPAEASATSLSRAAIVRNRTPPETTSIRGRCSDSGFRFRTTGGNRNPVPARFDIGAIGSAAARADPGDTGISGHDRPKSYAAGNHFDPRTMLRFRIPISDDRRQTESSSRDVRYRIRSAPHWRPTPAPRWRPATADRRPTAATGDRRPAPSRRRCGSARAGTGRRSSATDRPCRSSRSLSSRRTPGRPATPPSSPRRAC
jgi:hypothetical protein